MSVNTQHMMQKAVQEKSLTSLFISWKSISIVFLFVSFIILSYYITH